MISHFDFISPPPVVDLDTMSNNGAAPLPEPKVIAEQVEVVIHATHPLPPTAPGAPGVARKPRPKALK